MEKRNGRKLSLKELHFARKDIIRLYRSGLKRSAIVEICGLSLHSVSKAINLYKQNGMKALEPSKPGVRSGDRNRLTRDQEVEIQQMIRDKRPEQLKLDFALWNRTAVCLLVREKYGIELPIRTMGDYLKRWGFTPQKPIKRAYEQSSTAVQEWLDTTYPVIAKKAKEENADIHWGDETALKNTEVYGRSYSPRGKTPIAYVHGGSRKQVSMISSITNHGKVRWMIIEGAFNSDRFIEFLKCLIKDTDKKVYLILDNLGVHHSKPVKAWVEENKSRIELFFLPSYSPELNPDEKLNADMKHAIASAKCARTTDKLKSKAENHMAMLDKSPQRVRSFFQASDTRYAA